MNNIVDNTESAVWRFMLSLGLNMEDPNLKDTPARVARMYAHELLKGTSEEADNEIKAILDRTFPCAHQDLVLVRNHICYGVCPHHLLTVRYEASVGYIPTRGKVVGLSKLPRVVSLLAARPVLQEELGADIVSALEPVSEDVIVVLKGWHSCMSIRGVKSTEAVTITSALSGVFTSDASAKAEFMALLKL